MTILLADRIFFKAHYSMRSPRCLFVLGIFQAVLCCFGQRSVPLKKTTVDSKVIEVVTMILEVGRGCQGDFCTNRKRFGALVFFLSEMLVRWFFTCGPRGPSFWRLCTEIIFWGSLLRNKDKNSSACVDDLYLGVIYPWYSYVFYIRRHNKPLKSTKSTKLRPNLRGGAVAKQQALNAGAIPRFILSQLGPGGFHLDPFLDPQIN